MYYRLLLPVELPYFPTWTVKLYRIVLASVLVCDDDGRYLHHLYCTVLYCILKLSVMTISVAVRFVLYCTILYWVALIRFCICLWWPFGVACTICIVLYCTASVFCICQRWRVGVARTNLYCTSLYCVVFCIGLCWRVALQARFSSYVLAMKCLFVSDDDSALCKSTATDVENG